VRVREAVVNLTAWAWLIAPLGIARAAQIVLWDRIFDSPREWARRRLGSYVRYSLGCMWCTSTQLGLVTAALLAWDASRAPTLWVLTGLALSLVAVMIDRAIDASPLADPPDEATPEWVEQAFDQPQGQ
jgi:hypothetical protein